MVRQLIGIFALAFAIPGSAFSADPKVPPAKDPGLVPVAVVGSGIDYTHMSLAQRLARDGEGNIVGWDFVDNDIFPHSKDAVSNAQASLLLANPGVELVPVRVDAADYNGAGGAASFLSRTPVRIVVVTMTSQKKEDWAIFTKASEVFGKLLFVVPAGEAAALYPASLNLANVLSVTTPLAKADGANVAMAVPAETAAGLEASTAAAIVLATALATCHASALGEGDGKAMKTAAIAMAKQRSAAYVPAVEPCP